MNACFFNSFYSQEHTLLLVDNVNKSVNSERNPISIVDNLYIESLTEQPISGSFFMTFCSYLEQFLHCEE